MVVEVVEEEEEEEEEEEGEGEGEVGASAAAAAVGVGWGLHPQAAASQARGPALQGSLCRGLQATPLGPQRRRRRALAVAHRLAR